MKRKIVISALLLAFVCLASYTLFSISKKTHEKNLALIRTAKLPRSLFLNLDSVQVLIEQRKEKYSILLLFDSFCEHCQSEAQEFARLDTLYNAHLYCISSSSLSTIKSFAKDYGLLDKTYVSFLKLSSEDMFKTFGTLYFPQIFIYADDGNLIKQFKGETKIEAILQHLP